jgi:hypothetical protein
MSEEVTYITNKVLWKSRILHNTTFHISFSRLPFISDAPKYGIRPMLRESVIHGIRLFTIRHMLRDCCIVACSVASYNQTECHSPCSYFSSYSGYVDGIGTSLLAGWPGVRKIKRKGVKDFSLSQNVKTGSGAHSGLVWRGYRCSFSGVKRPESMLTTHSI